MKPAAELWVGLIQMSATTNKTENLATAKRLLTQCLATCKAPLETLRLLALPEVFNYTNPKDPSAGSAQAELLSPGNQTFDWATSLARELGIWLVAGSILEINPQDLTKPYNTSFVMNPLGELVQLYRKRHLFGLNDLVSGEALHREAKYRSAGPTMGASFRLGRASLKVGLGICFDLRFPELFLGPTMQNSSLMVLPSAFTYATGQAHWEILLRARAIENQCFVLAPNQGPATGCWGHSLIINPWGEVIASLEDQEESFLSAQLCLDEVQTARARMVLRED